MPEALSDGTVAWHGGMDTSRGADDISDTQYSKGTNVIIPDSLGGITSRFGFHCLTLDFRDKETEDIYRSGNIQGEGYFVSGNETYLICVVSGYIMRFMRTRDKSYFVENVTRNNRGSNTNGDAWVITIPEGCIVNNGFDYPVHVDSGGSRSLHPVDGEMGIGRMGVYLQNRLFMVDQSGRRILASDYLQPTKFTKEDTNIEGFLCPDEDERITAIGKQKSIISSVEGGNLIWSSTKDIYSVDVRGTRSDWSNVGSNVGKVTETIPGFSASSSYSFESFNTNLYFRSARVGIANIKQSQYQFVNLDDISSQSIEASYYLSGDTQWMLDKCYSRACNNRMYTTVSPEINDNGFIIWNGILSFNPRSGHEIRGSEQSRYESVFTGMRPWCLTVVPSIGDTDKMFVHSYDIDGINRMYVMDEDSNHDIDKFGEVKEIEGFIETRGYTHSAPLQLKVAKHRFYRLGLIDRTVKIKLFSRPEIEGRWTQFWDAEHLVGRTKVEDGIFVPQSSKGQTRAYVNTTEEKFSPCYKQGNRFITLQYRIEFTGPISLDSLVVSATLVEYEKTVSKVEKDELTLIYDFLPDYNYTINPQTQ